MKLLIVTQKVDRNDPILGFFHRWIEEFAKHCEKIIVICLQKGEFDLPGNVRVLSLGKEGGPSKLKYLWRFYKYIWLERKNYDKVFVHMNQEYVLLGGVLWRAWGKKVFMWRNHYAGNWLTDWAVGLCSRVFCTSALSYTAKYKRTILMPVGIDTDVFCPANTDSRRSGSILSLGRISPSKNLELLMVTLGALKAGAIDFTAAIYGDPLPEDREYYSYLKEQVGSLGLDETVKFFPAVPNFKTPEVYCAHEIFVNTSPSGMYDKTIFEAASCEAAALSCNKNLENSLWPATLLFKENDANDLKEKLIALLSLSPTERKKMVDSARHFVEDEHSLRRLTRDLLKELTYGR